MLERQDMLCTYPPHPEPESVRVIIIVIISVISIIAVSIIILVPAWTLQHNMQKLTPGRPSLLGFWVEIWDMFKRASQITKPHYQTYELVVSSTSTRHFVQRATEHADQFDRKTLLPM